jgi:hypothetical protein
VALERQQHLSQLARPLEADEATADADRGEVCLVTDALGELQTASEPPLEIEVYDRPLLTEIGSLARSRVRRPRCG